MKCDCVMEAENEMKSLLKSSNELESSVNEMRNVSKQHKSVIVNGNVMTSAIHVAN